MINFNLGALLRMNKKVYCSTNRSNQASAYKFVVNVLSEIFETYIQSKLQYPNRVKSYIGAFILRIHCERCYWKRLRVDHNLILMNQTMKQIIIIMKMDFDHLIY